VDRVGAAHDGEVVTVAAGVLVLPNELMQPEHIHERQAAQVQHDVPHAGRLRVQAIKHLGDLRHRDDVEFAAQRDQRGPTMRASLNNELLGAELLGERPDRFC